MGIFYQLISIVKIPRNSESSLIGAPFFQIGSSPEIGFLSSIHISITSKYITTILFTEPSTTPCITIFLPLLFWLPAKLILVNHSNFDQYGWKIPVFIYSYFVWQASKDTANFLQMSSEKWKVFVISYLLQPNYLLRYSKISATVI